MKKSLIVLGALAGLAVTSGAVAGLLSSRTGAVETSAAEGTNITIYYAISSSTVGSYTIKANLNDSNGWHSANMSKVSDVQYAGLDIYSVEINCTDSFRNLQFQLYNGDKWVSEVSPYTGSETNISAISGKLYNGSYWTTYSTLTTTNFENESATVYLDWYNWSNVYVYTYETVNGETYEMNGPFPGAQIDPTDTGLTFNGGKLQAVTIKAHELDNTHFLFSSGSDANKSDGMSIVNGAYYWHNGSAWILESGDRADAAAFVNDLNVARLAVARDDENDVKAYSICGLNASTWVSRYNSNDLSNTARGYIDAATIWTYKDSESSGADTTIAFSAIMNELSGRVSGVNIVSHATSQSNVIATASVASIGAVSLAGFFFIRKKRLL